MIKLIASDFDGTIFPYDMAVDTAGDIRVPERTARAVSAFIKQGGKFVLCTGRMFPAIRPYAFELGLTGELIAHQGAGVFDIETGRCLHSVLIPSELAAEYLSVVEQTAVCHVYIGDDYFINKINPYSERYKLYTGVQYRLAGEPLSEYVRERGEAVFKVYASVPAERKPALVAELEERFSGRLLISSSHARNIEAVNIRTSKSKALAELAESYGYDRSEIMAFGDAMNDLDMIVYAGTGVAVGSADPRLKEKADIVCDACADFGVAKVIESLL